EWFRISPIEATKVRSTEQVLAVWHTHPNRSAAPSEADLQGVEESKLDWIIVGISKTSAGFAYTEPTVTKPTGVVRPYTDRPYLYGVYDCYSLVRDYYKREFNLTLNAYQDEDKWWDRGENWFADNFQ